MVLIAGLCEARLRAAVGEHAQQNVQKLLEPAPEQAEVVACGGEHGVDVIAVAALEMVAARLAADGFGDAADLAADPDLEAVRTGVAAIALVAMDAVHPDTCELFQVGAGLF